jgi:DNA-binding transcriptional LysR family regulator
MLAVTAPGFAAAHPRLRGCVRSATQKKALERLVKRQPDVAIVWNETTVGVNLPGKKKP